MTTEYPAMKDFYEKLKKYIEEMTVNEQYLGDPYSFEIFQRLDIHFNSEKKEPESFKIQKHPILKGR